eukprot:TRINITY_DN4357_c0_g3_i4.p1 TRINITY_DN4357_c0_g3~~TRINITY_DN4357_c0_g3_i4.p1  ORF type:complete len:231 (+),score=7.78 TRINITY_DN4357_c0_g3_i4:460-1152(+)
MTTSKSATLTPRPCRAAGFSMSRPAAGALCLLPPDNNSKRPRRLFSGSHDGSIVVWNDTPGQWHFQRKATLHGEHCNTMALCGDADTLFARLTAPCVSETARCASARHPTTRWFRSECALPVIESAATSVVRTSTRFPLSLRCESSGCVLDNAGVSVVFCRCNTHTHTPIVAFRGSAAAVFLVALCFVRQCRQCLSVLSLFCLSLLRILPLWFLRLVFVSNFYTAWVAFV